MRLKTKRNNLILGAAVSAFLAISAFQYWNEENQATPRGPMVFSVELRSDGFYPKEITINKGDTVTFSTDRGVHYWPASNLHPTHGIFPEFDPLEPIEADKTWSFKFDKIGTWKYHDHLAPLYTGTITVREGNRVLGVGSALDCGTAETSEKQKCWEEVMDRAVLRNDLAAGFELVEKWYTDDPSFGTDCHSIMHRLGESAYKLYIRDKEFHITAKTSYCGFGFYHAFMESLLLDSRDMKQAADFCDYVNRKLGDEIPDAKGACFHGIGHGLTDNHILKSWTGEAELTMKPLGLCAQIAPTESLLNRCASGVFNVMAIKYSAGELKINKDDPLWYCRTLEKMYFKKPCYEEMNTALASLFKGDFKKAAQLFEAVPEDDVAASGIRSLINTYSSSYVNFQEPLKDCRALQGRLLNGCIHGFVDGLMETGRPGVEYEEALAFCGADGLMENERAECYKETIWLSRNYYAEDKYRRICGLIGSKNGPPCDL